MTCTAVKHGTATAYQAYGCRCPEARDAQRRYKKHWQRDKDTGRARRVPAIGTQRRIEALMTLGWSLNEIMTRAGYRDSGNWVKYDAVNISVRTAARVTAVYDELWDKAGPSQWTRTWARNRGFAPPMAWDDSTIDDPAASPDLGGADEDVDQVAVDRFIAGDIHWQRLTVDERLAAAVRMDRSGWSRQQIADATHLNSPLLQRTLVEANGRRTA
jgi:hypothetical protein